MSDLGSVSASRSVRFRRFYCILLLLAISMLKRVDRPILSRSVPESVEVRTLKRSFLFFLRI